MQGISPSNFSWQLALGGRFETPEAVMAWSDAGFGGVTDCFGRYVNETQSSAVLEKPAPAHCLQQLGGLHV